MRTVYWENGSVRLIDQTLLPHETVMLNCTDYQQVAQAIIEMRVRGAPAIGVTAAYGMALAAVTSQSHDTATLVRDLTDCRQPLLGH
jgi:methylthioribose-1-phosphate isomerase